MMNASQLLSHFFRVLGASEKQLENSRQEFYIEKRFNLHAAYEIFDRELKGYIEETDIGAICVNNSSQISKTDIFYALSVLDIHKKGRVTPQLFAKILSSSERLEIAEELRSRPKQPFNTYSMHLLLNFIQTLTKLGKQVEQAKRQLMSVDSYELFSLLDPTKKGCASFEEIKTFLMMNGKVSAESLTYIRKALSERQQLTLFPSTFNELIAPNQFVKHTLDSPLFKSQISRLSDVTNEDWRAELERNQLIRHKILDEVAERAVKCGGLRPNINEDKNSKKQYERQVRVNQSQETCRQLTKKIENLKQSLLKHSSSTSEGFRQGGESSLMIFTQRSTNHQNPFYEARTRRANEESVLRNEATLTIQKARQEARTRIQEIENLARMKVFSTRSKVPQGIPTSPLVNETENKIQELQDEKSKKLLLQKELNRSKSKISKLEAQLDICKRPTISKYGLASPRNPIIAAPQTNRAKRLQTQNEFPLYLQNKTKLINLQYSKLKSKLESQKKMRGFF